MVLQTVYFLAEILAAFAVVGSLIFVGLQVRRQAHQVAQQRLEQRIAHTASLRHVIFEFPELRRIVLKSNQELASLTQEEWFLYASWARRMLLLAQLIYAGLDRRAGEKPPRDAASNLARTFLQSGFQQFWKMFRSDFEPDFQTFIDELIEWGRAEGLSSNPFQAVQDQSKP